jgi:hypothetical protein
MMGGTVQKKFARAKQNLLTQHQQKFHRIRALVASARATQTSIGEKTKSQRKDFSWSSFWPVDCEAVKRAVR